MEQGIMYRLKATLQTNRYYLMLIAVYAFLLLFFCSQMSPLYPLNYWCDVNIYFNLGKGMFEGRTLYAEGFDHKGPMIFIIYGLGYLISNSSFLGVFIIQLLFWIAMLWAVYYTAKEFLSQSYSALIAIIFPIFVLKYTSYGGAAEEFVLVLNVVSLLFFVRYFKKADTNAGHNPWYMFIHGVMSSMAFFIKLNLILFWFFPLLVIFINLLINRQYRNTFVNGLAYLGGFALITAPIILYFMANGALEKAYSVYIVLNSQYASIPPTFGEIITLLFNRIYLFVRADLLSTVSITLGIFYFPIKFIKSRFCRLAFFLSGISLFIIISMTRSFFGYYNLPFYVFSVLGWIVIIYHIREYAGGNIPKKVFVSLFLILIAFTVTQKRMFGIGGDAFFKRSMVNGVVEKFSPIIQQKENPTLLNLGFGEANAIFTYCGIIPNVTYFTIPNIPHDLYPEMRDEQTRYIKEKLTDFVIVTNASMDYEYFKELPYLLNNYELIDTYIDTRDYLGDEFYTYYLYKVKQ